MDYCYNLLFGNCSTAKKTEKRNNKKLEQKRPSQIDPEGSNDILGTTTAIAPLQDVINESTAIVLLQDDNNESTAIISLRDTVDSRS